MSTTALPDRVHVDAPDGTVSLHPPTDSGMPWLAFATPATGSPSAVLWLDEPETYLCVSDGYAPSAATGCEHIWAAINARHDAEHHTNTSKEHTP